MIVYIWSFSSSQTVSHQVNRPLFYGRPRLPDGHVLLPSTLHLGGLPRRPPRIGPLLKKKGENAPVMADLPLKKRLKKADLP